MHFSRHFNMYFSYGCFKVFLPQLSSIMTLSSPVPKADAKDTWCHLVGLPGSWVQKKGQGVPYLLVCIPRPWPAPSPEQGSVKVYSASNGHRAPGNQDLGGSGRRDTERFPSLLKLHFAGRETSRVSPLHVNSLLSQGLCSRI